MVQALPDFLVRSDAFDKGMHRIWNAGDRFRMYFGGRAGSKSGKHSNPLSATMHIICQVYVPHLLDPQHLSNRPSI